MPFARSCPRVLVTGSSGFIGSHVCESLRSRGAQIVGVDRVRPTAHVPYEFVEMDIGGDFACTRLRGLGTFDAVLHLAARAEVVVPVEEIPELWTTNVTGTLNVVTSVRAGRVVFASSCAVYGDVSAAAQPTWSAVGPLGAYGISKASAELCLRAWARATHTSTIVLRFGNVIGARCRGLVPYLVSHARSYPDAKRPAQLRGRGRIVRDYVPVEHVVGIMAAAALGPRVKQECAVFNIGTGRGLTNGYVARQVRDQLGSNGHQLQIRFDAPLAQGEARRAVIDPTRTERVFHVASPSSQAVKSALCHAVDSHMGQGWIADPADVASDRVRIGRSPR